MRVRIAKSVLLALLALGLIAAPARADEVVFSPQKLPQRCDRRGDPRRWGRPNRAQCFLRLQCLRSVKASDCKKLKFRPRLNLRLFGATHRSQHPRLKAVLKTRRSGANIALRSSNNPLPDLVARLKGQVEIVLDGKIDSFHGGIRTTFTHVPDLPVSKFVMTLPGGKHGLLVASTNLCAEAGQGDRPAQSSERPQGESPHGPAHLLQGRKRQSKTSQKVVTKRCNVLADTK